MSWYFEFYSFDNEDRGLDPVQGLGQPVIGIAGRVRDIWEAKADTPTEFLKIIGLLRRTEGFHPDFSSDLWSLATYEEYQDNEFDLQDAEGNYVKYGLSIEGSPDHVSPTIDEQIEWLKSLPPRR